MDISCINEYFIWNNSSASIIKGNISIIKSLNMLCDPQ